MKIISGKYKGRSLDGFHIQGTRPTMDRVKESVFAMIQSKIPDAVVLDLFAGSGNLGIEALSEGAKTVYFVDKSKICYQTILKNLKQLDIKLNTVFLLDYSKALELFFKEKISFDIIFLDPPYQTDLVEKSIFMIDRLSLLSLNGILVVETDDLEKLIFPSHLEVVKSKKYGDKWVAILRQV